MAKKKPPATINDAPADVAAKLDTSDLIARVKHSGGVHVNGEFFECGSFFRIIPSVAAAVNRMVGPVVELALAAEIPADLIRTPPADFAKKNHRHEERAELEKKYLRELVAAKVDAYFAKVDADEEARAKEAAERGLKDLARKRIEQAKAKAQRARDLRHEADELERTAGVLAARFGGSLGDDAPAPTPDDAPSPTPDDAPAKDAAPITYAFDDAEHGDLQVAPAAARLLGVETMGREAFEASLQQD